MEWGVTRAKQIANILKVNIGSLTLNFVLHVELKADTWENKCTCTFSFFLGFVCVYSKSLSTWKVLLCKHLRYVTFFWGRTWGVRTLRCIQGHCLSNCRGGRMGMGGMYKRKAGTHHPQSNLELEGNTASSIHSGNRRHRRRCWELGQSKNNFWSLGLLL